MHARNRNNPGNGYRSISVGMGGLAAASRISPETSMRGHGGYNSDFRNYNRGGFGRGQSRHFQRSQTLPQKGGDVFVEAGKLATEYLVSKGSLPANALSGKWQTDNLKNQIGTQEGDGLQLSLEGRTSALSRLGGPVSDTTFPRRYPDDYNSIGSTSFTRGRRRNGSFKNYGSDWSREVGRSGSWSERSRASADGDSDAFSRHPNEQQVSNDGESVSQNSPQELVPETDGGCETESALGKYKPPDDAVARVSSSFCNTDPASEGDVEPPKRDDVIKISNTEAGDTNDSKNIQEKEQETKDEQVVVTCSGKDNLAGKRCTDLLKLCSFAKVPTRMRSSVAIRGSKVDTDPTIVDNVVFESAPPAEREHHVGESTGDSLSMTDMLKCISGSKSVGSDDSKVSAAEDELVITYDLGQQNSSASIPSLNGSSLKDEQINVLPEFGRTNSTLERGEKRVIDDDDSRMGSKRSRESAYLESVQPAGCLLLSDSLEKQQTSPEAMNSEGNAVTLPPDGHRSLDISLYPKGDTEPCMGYTEEMQLFPGSFKTCDLNLMETSDVNENHEDNPILMFPSITDTGKQVVPVDIDLSMSNNSHLPNKYGKCSIDDKNIEVIDLEDDSVQEGKEFNNSERRTENVFTSLESFSNNTHNATDISDAQDGYGLMISELLGNDIPNCSSVPADMNSLHNDMNLHNGEGILGDDDSIYMSLGEIPISFLRVWEQPTQEYGKPF